MRSAGSGAFIICFAGAVTDHQIQSIPEILAELCIPVAQGLLCEGVAPRSQVLVIAGDMVMAQQPFGLPERRIESGSKTRADGFDTGALGEDRKSTRLNSSHVKISYAVF